LFIGDDDVGDRDTGSIRATAIISADMVKVGQIMGTVPMMAGFLVTTPRVRDF
jgi:hypothetical protein